MIDIRMDRLLCLSSALGSHVLSHAIHLAGTVVRVLKSGRISLSKT